MITRLKQWLADRRLPRATESIARGNLLVYTDTRRKYVRKATPGDGFVIGVANHAADIHERVVFTTHLIYRLTPDFVPMPVDYDSSLGVIYYTPDNPPRDGENLPNIHFVDNDRFAR